MRRSQRWWVILVIFTAALTLTLSNCTPQTATTSSGSANAGSGTNTLVFGAVGDPVTLESGNATDAYSGYVQQQLYDRLLDFEPGTTTLIPALATDWSVSDDRLRWTFKLREGVKFHDGTDFNAEAVRANVNRWWNPDDPLGFREAGKTYEIWPQLFGGFKGSDESLLQDLRVVDDYTVEFILKQPFAAFPAAIASGYFGFSSPAAIRQAGADYGLPSVGAVGTGPYKFVEWRNGDRVVLTNNPDYWQADLPKTDELIFRTIKESSSRLAELRTGSIDFAESFSPEQLSEINRDTNLEERRRPSFNVGYLALNPSYEPLSKKEVRHAIAMSINKQALVDAFWSGLAVTDPHFTPPSMKAYQDQSLRDYEYNPDRAKQLLAEAGYPDGFDLELWYSPITGTVFPTPKPIAEAWAADLAAVGIRVSLNTKDWAAYLADRNKAPGYQAFMLAWGGDYGDPDNFYYPHFGPGSTADIGNWKNDRVFQLLDEARSEEDETRRAQMYAEVDRILHDEAVRLPMVHSEPLLVQRTNLTGWTPSPLGNESFATIEKS
ncbi:ABC transporter substrate-binding protein [Thermocoleostomius sinensis]|uniref:ABC transporter substrate-binding protein n=1 Tax=Thermocoleostomius sinensis A174 TaxID=2016057 RepID=A0A9E8ZEU3_9CYAN|nr:ABC transporter substrate-binding protein [Thermocoleostomius sinensis]WAL61521.1 ABC transporter substrate-binding protein [Thermocoleostomius sinensis A174]